MHRRIGALVLSAVVTVGGAAAAADPVSLVWNAPQEECPAGSAVLAQVHGILGSATSHHAVARADVTHADPERWSVHLQTDVDGVQGERTIDATSCESLATATALILALTVDPSKARANLPVEPPPKSGAAAPSAEPPPSPSPAPPRGKATRLGAFVAIAGAGDLGTMPSPALAPEVSAGVLFGPVRVELSGDDWGAQDATPKGNPSEGAHIHLYDVTARGCFRWRLEQRVELDPCGGAGLVYATSDGFSTANNVSFTPYQGKSGTWMTANGDLLAAWGFFGPLALRASVGAGLPLARPPFVVLQQQGPSIFLHRSAAIIGRASVGLEARFP